MLRYRMSMPLFRPFHPFDIICIGDTVVDTFLTIEEATISCQLHHEQCLLCLEYAEKIPVKAVTKIPGAGNASNAAVGSRRLGSHVAIASIIATDAASREILAHWKQERIPTTYVTRDPKHETNLSTILNFQGERTILVYHHAHAYHLPRLGSTDWIYYTSLGPKHESLEKQLLQYLERHPKTRLAFNPGTHQLRRGLKSLRPAIARTNAFIVNREEAERLLNDGRRPLPNLLMSFIQLDAKIVVITDGEHGSYATDGTRCWRCPIFPGPVIERTGAGDSYATAFVHALHSGTSIPEAMRHGTANAWSVIQKVGPQAGLLTAPEMKKILARFKRLQPKKL